MELTPSQLEAIAHRDGHLQLVACAGSGKTEVVARRVARLLDPGASDALAPRNLVAFTFTEKAAAELKDRIAARVREAHGEVVGLAEMFVGTIHGFCLELLQREVPRFLKYSVLDEVRQRLLVERHRQRSGFELVTRLDEATPLEPWKDTSLYLGVLDVLRQADVVASELHGAPALDALAAWRELLEDRRYLDYTAIMEHAAHALRDDEPLRARLRARLRHVIVDEYQDVNPLQERVVSALAELGAWLCVVGDDDQTLYQWNGADVRNILGFEARYPGIRTVRLQENFRSSRAIVTLARDFIAQTRDRLPKSMEATDAQPSDPGDVAACAFESPDAEAAWIADTLASLHGAAFEDRGVTRGVAWSDMAVLVRSALQRNAAPVAEALRARGIPCLVGGVDNLFGAPEARAARALVHFVAGRDEVDREAVKRAWIEADLGVEPDGFERALDHAAATRDEIPFETSARVGEYAPLRVFGEFLDRLCLREERVPGERGRGEAAFYNLGVFSRLLGDFEAIHHHTGPAEKYARLSEFLERAGERYGEGLLDNPFASPDAVRITTIHKAKGLEWPVVAIPGVTRNRFPNTWRGTSNWWNVLPLRAVEGAARYQGDEADERRLFYVALTRARKWLLVSHAPSPTARSQRYPSPFFEWMRGRPGVAAKPPRYDERPHTTPAPRASVADVRLTFTRIKHLFECGYQFKLRELYGFRTAPEPAAGYGKALHDALAEVHLRALGGYRCTADDVPALVDEHLHLPFATPDVFLRLRETATAAIALYLERHGDALDRVEFTEKSIELALGDGVTVSGRIDLVVRRDDGAASIVDFKSTERAQSEEQTETQLHLYALGYRALTGRDARSVEVWELDHDRRHVSHVDDALLDGVRATVKRAAEMLRTGELPPSPERSRCGRCEFRAMCTAGAAAVEG